jgi:hypothetical protein
MNRLSRAVKSFPMTKFFLPRTYNFWLSMLRGHGGAFHCAHAFKQAEEFFSGFVPYMVSLFV